MYFYHFSYGPSIPVQWQKARFWILIFSSRSRMHRLVLSRRSPISLTNGALLKWARP